jgi:hypothetical protein
MHECNLSPLEFAGGVEEVVGSFVAVGTFHPSIEIWNLDVIDSLEPSAVLGGIREEVESAAASKKKKKKGKKTAKVPLVPTPRCHARCCRV